MQARVQFVRQQDRPVRQRPQDRANHSEPDERPTGLIGVIDFHVAVGPAVGQTNASECGDIRALLPVRSFFLSFEDPYGTPEPLLHHGIQLDRSSTGDSQIGGAHQPQDGVGVAWIIQHLGGECHPPGSRFGVRHQEIVREPPVQRQE